MRLIPDQPKKDKVEIVKQQQAEIQKMLDSRIRPHENHTLFEVDLKTYQIRLAEFDELGALKWEDAVKGLISANRKVTKKEGCVYISALNKENAIKILKRQFGVAVVQKISND